MQTSSLEWPFKSVLLVHSYTVLLLILFLKRHLFLLIHLFLVYYLAQIIHDLLNLRVSFYYLDYLFLAELLVLQWNVQRLELFHMFEYLWIIKDLLQLRKLNLLYILLLLLLLLLLGTYVDLLLLLLLLLLDLLFCNVLVFYNIFNQNYI